ncbi:hypothetical protein WICPIJ_004879 [Wickerhamomyces pijperi]|uniref:Uncharacterized protein n=1 Tax=Wickerhamomyces pijperi TaxID=599730 RepID=A0A9P8Q799_WICPI|nr:hypothetical protein WICPIJ_004879 [Wickerhamomyces pijperi]
MELTLMAGLVLRKDGSPPLLAPGKVLSRRSSKSLSSPSLSIKSKEPASVIREELRNSRVPSISMFLETVNLLSRTSFGMSSGSILGGESVFQVSTTNDIFLTVNVTGLIAKARTSELTSNGSTWPDLSNKLQTLMVLSQEAEAKTEFSTPKDKQDTGPLWPDKVSTNWEVWTLQT